MDLTEFLAMLLGSDLTTNELSILLEAGYGAFTREDLLKNPDRVPIGVYTPAALTRTLQKLGEKNWVVALPHAGGKTSYQLAGGGVSYAPFTGILLAVARSKVMTLNTLRTALQLICNQNEPCSARYLAKQLTLTPDYLASAVLPRLYVMGLLKKELLTHLVGPKHHTSEDNSTSTSKLLLFRLDTGWAGYVDEDWL